MTDPEALPDEDLSAWPIDEFGWDWDDPRVDREPEPSGPPWYRSPGPLLALISGAAATLVVAVTLLITDSGEIPTQPALGTKAVPSSAPSASRAAPAANAPGPSTPASASPAAEGSPSEGESPAPAAVAEAAEPAAPAGAPPPAPLPVDGPGTLAGTDSEGPRINVTRSPMSFTPGSSTKG